MNLQSQHLILSDIIRLFVSKEYTNHFEPKIKICVSAAKNNLIKKPRISIRGSLNV